MATQTYTSTNKASLLRYALRGNGIFSLLSGLVLLLQARAIADFIGLTSPPVLTITGIVLILYGADLLYFASQEELDLRVGIMAIVLDVLWVVGSAVILLIGWPPLTTAGKWSVLIVADIVAVFAAVQFYGLRRIKRAA